MAWRWGMRLGENERGGRERCSTVHRDREEHFGAFWRYIGSNLDFRCTLNVEKMPQNVPSMS